MSVKTDIRRAKQQTIEQLLELRDHAKLQLHLLSMDARRAFTRLEGRVQALESETAREGEHTLESVKKAAHELTREMNEFMTTHINASLGLLTSVRSLMTTHVRTCGCDDSLNHAAHLMWNNDCGLIPVLSFDRVVGVVTDRDICMATYTQGKAPGELRVDSAMSKEVISCLPDDSLGSALANMGDKRVRRLPVITAEGKLIGILTSADVLRWARSLTNPAVDAALVDALAAISARTPHMLASAAE